MSAFRLDATTTERSSGLSTNFAAIEVTVAAGVLTRDLGGTATTQDVTKALIDALNT